MKKNSASRGSLTLEASIMVPLFIMLMLLVNGFFILFMGQQVMTNALVQSAKSLSFDPYSIERVDGAASSSLMTMFTDFFSFVGGNYTTTEKWYEETDDLEDVIEERFIAYLRADERDAHALLETLGVENGIYGLDFSGSSVDGDVLTINLKYNQEYIFNTFGLGTMERELTVKVKLFTYKKAS